MPRFLQPSDNIQCVEEWLKTHLKCLCEDFGATKVEVEADRYSADNQQTGFLGSLKFVQVAVKCRPGFGSAVEEEKLFHLVIKLPPSRDNRYYGVAVSNRLFIREAWFYSVLQTELSRLIRTIRPTESGTELAFAKSYYSEGDDENVTLVMENLKFSRYETYDIKKIHAGGSFSVEEVKCVFSSLATFHGCTIAYQKIFVVDYSKMPQLSDKFTNPDELRSNYHWSGVLSVYEDYAQYFLELAEAKYVKSAPVYQRIKDISEDIASRYFYDMSRPTTPALSTICHGDFGVHNLMMKYDDQGHPSSIKMIDFQFIRYASLTMDIQTFLSLATTRAFRRLHLEKLLKYYYQRLKEILQSFKLEPSQLDIISYQLFIEDFRYHLPMRLFFAGEGMVLLFGKDPLSDDSAAEASNGEEDSVVSSRMRSRTDSVRGTIADTRILDIIDELANDEL